MRAGLALAMLMTLAAAAGCGEDAPPPGSFAPLQYGYLAKLRLNVGAIDVQDHSTPLGPDDISTRSPVTPAQALVEIGHDRLFAAGLQGQAQFVIDQASIVRGSGGALYGNMAIHLEVTSSGGTRTGYAEARVARTHVPGSDDESLPAVLYAMTKQMADAMNVELEYQIRRSMADFLAAAEIVPSAVTAMPLGPSGGPPLPPASVAVPPPPPPAGPPPENPLPPETPPAGEVPAPDAPPMQMSPPPGYLRQPGEP